MHEIKNYNIDYAKSFLIENLSLNGKIISLNSSITTLISQHGYNHQQAIILAEALMVLSMLGKGLKSDNSILTIEFHKKEKNETNNSLILVVDYRKQGDIRGYLNQSSQLENLFNTNSTYQMVITFDESGHRYQSVVNFSGSSFQDALMNYFKSSQQLDVLIKIAIDKKDNSWRARGIMVNKLPAPKEDHDYEWNKVEYFIESLTNEEILELEDEVLLYRLFHQDSVYTFAKEEIKHSCSCSREKFLAWINKIEDKTSLYCDDDKIIISCEFCGKKEIFENII